VRVTSSSIAYSRGERRTWIDEVLWPSDASFFDALFAERSQAVMPPGLAQALGPVLEQIAEMTIKIKQYDRQIHLAERVG
jgi:hypothetical protein